MPRRGGPPILLSAIIAWQPEESADQRRVRGASLRGMGAVQCGGKKDAPFADGLAPGDPGMESQQRTFLDYEQGPESDARVINGAPRPYGGHEDLLAGHSSYHIPTMLEEHKDKIDALREAVRRVRYVSCSSFGAWQCPELVESRCGRGDEPFDALDLVTAPPVVCPPLTTALAVAVSHSLGCRHGPRCCCGTVCVQGPVCAACLTPRST